MWDGTLLIGQVRGQTASFFLLLLLCHLVASFSAALLQDLRVTLVGDRAV